MRNQKPAIYLQQFRTTHYQLVPERSHKQPAAWLITPQYFQRCGKHIRRFDFDVPQDIMKMLQRLGQGRNRVSKRLLNFTPGQLRHLFMIAKHTFVNQQRLAIAA